MRTESRSLLRRLLLEEDDTAGLPPRVIEAVRARQDASERLIGWVQLTLVLLFGTLYVIAPKTHMDAFWASPVPIALMLYLLFTLVRLLLSYRISLPDWYLGLSGMVDLALLMTLIWSFHIQYAQPAPFYLKAPTMLYVFIFIALRALRFEPRYVLRTGLAAALGWTVLVVYALRGDASDHMPLTRDYVQYLTDNKVLLGGELDKILSILVVTALLTVALIRGRRTLIQGIAEAHASAQLSRFFAPEIAERITQGDTGMAEEVPATVLYIDIRDFTALSNRIGPGQLMTVLDEYQGRMTPIITAHGGTVERFTGDGVLASFGAAKPLPDYAKCGLEAATAVLAEADRWSQDRRADGHQPIEIGVALTSGPLIIGAVGGSGGKLEYTMVGEPANRASKIEKHNKSLGTRALADAETLVLARAQGWAGTPIAEYPGETVAEVERPVDLAVLG